MINANELRINNYLYYNGNHNHIGIVTSIQPRIYFKTNHTSGGVKIGFNNRFDIVYELDKVKPIPLTEEWLLKFGFVYNGWNYDFERFTFHAQGKNSKGEFYNTEFYIKRGKTKCLISFKIEFVHQLQNLYFSLIGEELTLKQ